MAVALWDTVGWVLLCASLVTLIWLPWWVVVIGIAGKLLLHGSNQESATGFVKEAALEDASAYRAALISGVLTVTAREQ